MGEQREDQSAEETVPQSTPVARLHFRALLLD